MKKPPVSHWNHRVVRRYRTAPERQRSAGDVLTWLEICEVIYEGGRPMAFRSVPGIHASGADAAAAMRQSLKLMAYALDRDVLDELGDFGDGGEARQRVPDHQGEARRARQGQAA